VRSLGISEAASISNSTVVFAGTSNQSPLDGQGPPPHVVCRDHRSMYRYVTSGSRVDVSGVEHTSRGYPS
jgi:hypothetical protein